MPRVREYHIVMADIIESRSKPGKTVSRQLESIVRAANKAPGVISPFVVTLGDEFQGIVANLHSACQSILQFEYQSLKQNVEFRLRYSLHKGVIETPINRERAHGMLGPGLTRAREMLNEKAPGRPRVLVDLGNSSLDDTLQHLFSVLTALKDRWKVRDYALVMAMLAEDNDSRVAKEFEKNRSQIWKRRNTLLVQEYRSIASVIAWVSNEFG